MKSVDTMADTMVREILLRTTEESQHSSDFHIFTHRTMELSGTQKTHDPLDFSSLTNSVKDVWSPAVKWGGQPFVKPASLDESSRLKQLSKSSRPNAPLIERAAETTIQKKSTKDTTQQSSFCVLLLSLQLTTGTAHQRLESFLECKDHPTLVRMRQLCSLLAQKNWCQHVPRLYPEPGAMWPLLQASSKAAPLHSLEQSLGNSSNVMTMLPSRPSAKQTPMLNALDNRKHSLLTNLVFSLHLLFLANVPRPLQEHRAILSCLQAR